MATTIFDTLPPLRQVFPPVVNTFEQDVIEKFGQQSVDEIKGVLQKLQLPLPQGTSEHFPGRTGVHLFIDRYGVAVKIEHKDDPDRHILRVNTSEWVVKPLATLQLSNAILEICPGCRTNADWDDVQTVSSGLREEGIYFHDSLPANVGFSPIKTPAFPEGRPVLIDRISVSWLSNATREIREALAKKGPAPEDEAYAPLVKAFAGAWPQGASAPDAAKMQGFWDLCRRFRNDGKLVAGWASPHSRARSAGACYEERLKACHGKGALAKTPKTPSR